MHGHYVILSDKLSHLKDSRLVMRDGTTIHDEAESMQVKDAMQAGALSMVPEAVVHTAV